jgi:hypothetical protein
MGELADSAGAERPLGADNRDGDPYRVGWADLLALLSRVGGGPAQDWSTASLTGLGTWQLTWVGLDVLEVAGLASTGYLLRRSHYQTRTAALLAAPLFVVDGWFDVLTAASRSDMAVSVAMLGLAELPVAILLVLIARRAREFESHRFGLSR